MADKDTTQGGTAEPTSTEQKEQNAEKVLSSVRDETAMPLLEIAAKTGVRGDDLADALNKLEAEKLVKVEKTDDPLDAIVSIGLTNRNL